MSQELPSGSSVVDYSTPPNANRRRGAAFWVGWVISGLQGALLLLGGVIDVIKPPSVVEELAKIGFEERAILPLGVVIIVSTLLFLIPRTVLFGAILLTAYLGGAVCLHVMKQEYGMMIAPVVFAVVMWVSVVLRDRRVRAAAFG